MPVRTALSARDQMHADRTGETIAPLVGGTVLDATIHVTDDEFDGPVAWPVLVVACPDGVDRVLLIQRDPEGNGPGHPQVVGTFRPFDAP